MDSAGAKGTRAHPPGPIAGSRQTSRRHHGIGAGAHGFRTLSGETKGLVNIVAAIVAKLPRGQTTDALEHAGEISLIGKSNRARNINDTS